MPVPLLDLKAQYATLQDELDAAIRDVVESQYFVMGPQVVGLEEEIAAYTGAPFAVGVASGTDALLIPLIALEPKAEEEVVIPSFTFFATAGAVWNAGFRPVFCDVDPDTFNVTAETLEASMSERTRVVVPVHLFGQMAPMVEINRMACGHEGVLVMEDAAQAIGAAQRDEGGAMRRAGAAGFGAAFSFFPTKNLGGFGDGGMVTLFDEDFSDRIAKLRVHGGRQMYHHEMVGTNSRLDALQAAVLRVKLKHLDGWAEGRRTNACRYHERLKEVAELRLPVVAEGNHHVYNQFTIRAERRDELRAFLSDREIGSGIYYPKPLHLQECFAELGHREGEFPVTERLCGEVLSLPIFPELGEERVDEVAAAIRDFYGYGG